MSPGIIALIVVAIIALALVGLVFARPQLQRQRLRMRFGDEYDHAVRAHQSHAEAERELLAREERHRKLNLRPLEPEARERYQAEWTAIQERFVDDPRAAAGEAERLITSIMRDQGYPDEGHDQRLADLSVGRTRAVGHYRMARDIGSRAVADGVSTEDLRQALMHYRAVFDDLLDGRSIGRTGGHSGGRSGGLLGGWSRAAGREHDDARTEKVGGR
ncbi:MAG TPA: hypothetical protein VE465_03295 [Streptosporangiaceae bacterium]|jgi:hypothetical protein|nr:hypothetical protein [Streptosporangiaceae bacterium]